MLTNIIETKQLRPEGKEELCYQEPYEEDEWKITLSGETFKQTVSGVYCHPTDDAEALFELRNDIFTIVRAKEAYQALPDAVGGYE